MKLKPTVYVIWKAAVAWWLGLGFGAGEFMVRNPIPLKIWRVWGLLHAKSYVVAKHPPVGVARKLGEGVPNQMSCSSSDRGSKFRGPSQNSSRVASKRAINITKLSCVIWLRSFKRLTLTFFSFPTPH
ncbi:hypothetical protein AVEN_35045-1 [Araneus ventricosus]|uniref:Uncharacterized protein n=1 Tax=Araneus ventricosus TaxID=182803 RepID=A0A4Y2JS85_ARAVE|nr:hypothetical protein AVEN_35045-1 [Araneus ventricosus]